MNLIEIAGNLVALVIIAAFAVAAFIVGAFIVMVVLAWIYDLVLEPLFDWIENRNRKKNATKYSSMSIEQVAVEVEKAQKELENMMEKYK